MVTIPDATRASLPVLLAAYLAEPDGSDGAHVYAQHIVERLIADDVLWQLSRLHDQLGRLHTAAPAEVWRTIEQAVDVLDAIVGEAQP